MVSNFSYYSLKGLNLKDRVPFITLLAVVVGFVVAAVDLPRFLFFLSLMYALSGPLWYLYRRVRRLPSHASPLSHKRGGGRGDCE